jgi:hypothetical protein
MVQSQEPSNRDGIASEDGVSASLYRIKFRTVAKIRIKKSGGKALFK